VALTCEIMSEEARRRAEFQDTLFRAANRDDVAYYRGRAEEVDGPVLELGCGTGRIYLELLDAGIDADGVELSDASLSVLRENAAERDLDPSVWRGDMSDFAVDREYDLIYCPFNAIQELTSIEDQQGLLASAYDALAPGGQFVFGTFVPDIDYIAENWGEWQTRTVEFRGESVEYHTRTTLVDAVSQTYTTEQRAVWPDGSELFSFEGRATLLPAREIELLVQTAPFDSYRATGDYTDQALADGHSAQVWILKK
jgi:SAM-dependent methyltransferase